MKTTGIAARTTARFSSILPRVGLRCFPVLAAVGMAVLMVKAASGQQSPNPQSAIRNPQLEGGLAPSVDTNTPPLERKVSLSAQQMPLKDAFAAVCRAAKVELDFDIEGLELNGQPADLPITVTIKDETLESALGRIFVALQYQHAVQTIYRELHGKKLLVSSAARTLRDLPDWLKPLYNHGVFAKLDQDRNVFSIYAGDKADDAFLAKLTTLPKLRELDIEATKTITTAGLEHLTELPALEKLKLYQINTGNAGLGNEALRIVAPIRTLRDLSIEECNVTDDGARALEGMTQLTALNLSGNQLTDAGMKSLAGLTNLESLDVSSHMQITDEGIKQLSRLTELRQFTPSSLAISGKGVPFPHLQSLFLSGELVTDAALDSIIQCRDLRRLGLSFTLVTDKGLAKLPALKELRQLNLDSREITDAGIAHLRDLPKLESLRLRVAGLDDESLRHVSQIKSLGRLDLWGGVAAPYMSSGQLFTVEGLQQLKNLPQLRDLTLNNFNAPTGYMGLRTLKGLRSLSLDFSGITDAEVQLLKRAMPDTFVEALREYVIMELPIVPPPPLPNDSVFLSGRVVDDATGRPVTNCQLQFGALDPAKPDGIIWAEVGNSESGAASWGGAAKTPPIEVSGKHPNDPGFFWGETFRTGKVCARIIAPGYQPFPLTPNPALSTLIAPMRLTNLVLRMRHGGDLHGIMLDYRGNPMPNFSAYLDDVPYFSIRNGNVDTYSKSRPATTDPAGRFTLAGGNGTEQKVVFASPDCHMVWMAPKVDPEHEARVTLPQPATLTLRYDIPDDSSVAELALNFIPPKPDSDIWKGVNFGINVTVSNKAEIVLTNLTPGTYSLGRNRTLNFGGAARAGRGGSSGSRFIWLDEQTFVLEPGRTQRVEIVRPTGQTVRGEVAGITENGALGAYIYAYSGKTNITDDMLGWGWPFDALTCGTNGVFQTARLEPGTYNIVAMAYKEGGASPNPHSGNPDFVGSAKVTVTTNAPPDPLKIELLPRGSAANQPSP